jgi:hypothetical protein
LGLKFKKRKRDLEPGKGVRNEVGTYGVVGGIWGKVTIFNKFVLSFINGLIQLDYAQCNIKHWVRASE